MRTLVSIVTTIGLAAALGAAVTASPAAATDPAGGEEGRAFEMRGAPPASSARRADGATQLVSATATFAPANRAPGMPTSAAPEHQLVMPGGSLSVTVDYGYDWQTGALTYHYSLDADLVEPGPSTVVRLGFGAFQGTTCMIEEVTTARSYQYIPDVLLYDNKDTADLASAAGWNCAALVIGSSDPAATPHDAFVSAMTVTTATPELSLSVPRKDRLVKGVWTRIPVTVANAAAEGIDARDVVVTGRGKGVKVRKLSLGSLTGQDDTETHVWAKLARPRARLRLTVSEMGSPLGRATVKLKQRAAPAPPRTGAWSAPGVSFTVRGGKVRGFSLQTQTTCGGYPDLPTTTTNTYSFQAERIPKNNEVVGTEKGNQGGDAAYTAYLELEFVSRTKAKGKFSYYGPARCTAFDSFTVTRR